MTIHDFRRTAAPGLALALALGLTACSGGDSNQATPGDEEFLAGSPSQTSGPTSSDDDASEAPGESAGPEASDLNAAALRAIAVAEDEAGGTAYAIDDAETGGTWEVSVAVGNRTAELEVDEAGTVVTTEDDDLDVEDRSAIDDATITIADAIDRVLAHSGGVLTDAELDDGTHWSVTVDEDGDEVDYRVDIESGELTGDED